MNRQGLIELRRRFNAVGVSSVNCQLQTLSGCSSCDIRWYRLFPVCTAPPLPKKVRKLLGRRLSQAQLELSAVVNDRQRYLP